MQLSVMAEILVLILEIKAGSYGEDGRCSSSGGLLRRHGMIAIPGLSPLNVAIECRNWMSDVEARIPILLPAIALLANHFIR